MDHYPASNMTNKHHTVQVL